MKYIVYKSVMQRQPPWVEKTIIGIPMNSIAQYRGKNGLHIREYENRFEIHADLFDPLSHPFLHFTLEFMPAAIRLIIENAI